MMNLPPSVTGRSLHHYGLDADGIVDQVRSLMGREYEADEDWEDE